MTLAQHPARRPPGLGELLAQLAAEARALLGDLALLAALDARRSALRLAQLLAAGLGAAVLLVTAWMALVAALTVWLWGEGMGWPAALAIAAAVNVGGSAALLLWLRHLAAELPFDALLRQLRGERTPHEARPGNPPA